MFNEKTWKDGEKIAADYMRKHGYKIKYTNFSCVGVELDIIATLPRKVQIKNLKKEYKEKIKNTKIIENKRALRLNLKNLKSNVSNLLIVCEVKARSKNDFGMGYEAVNATKQRNIARGAEYVLTLKEFKNMQIRFDVASVDGEKVTYLENAFTC